MTYPRGSVTSSARELLVERVDNEIRALTGVRQPQTPYQADPRLDHHCASAAIPLITVGRCLERIHREANSHGDQTPQPDIASGARHESRLPIPSGFF